jgi:hypothetical protein
MGVAVATLIARCISLAAAATLWTLAVTDVAEAQTCFRGRPLPTCRSFWITEAGYARRLSPAEDHGDVELGRMWNLGSRIALGGTVTGAYHSGFQLVLKPRVRRWLRPPLLSAELAAGVVVAGGPWGDVGFTGEAALNVGDRLSLLSRLESVEGYASFGQKVGAWSIGIKLGSAPGAVAGTLLAILGALYAYVCNTTVCD